MWTSVNSELLSEIVKTIEIPCDFPLFVVTENVESFWHSQQAFFHTCHIVETHFKSNPQFQLLIPEYLSNNILHKFRHRWKTNISILNSTAGYEYWYFYRFYYRSQPPKGNELWELSWADSICRLLLWRNLLSRVLFIHFV